MLIDLVERKNLKQQKECGDLFIFTCIYILNYISLEYSCQLRQHFTCTSVTKVAVNSKLTFNYTAMMVVGTFHPLLIQLGAE